MPLKALIKNDIQNQASKYEDPVYLNMSGSRWIVKSIFIKICLIKINSKLYRYQQKMFPINGQFYFPMLYFSQMPQAYANSEPIFPETHPFFNKQTPSSPHCIPHSETQIERECPNLQQISQPYNPDQSQLKSKDLQKKKKLRKNFLNQREEIDQKERLRRKLANRPKTYQTEKKMYQNADLSDLGLNLESRTLRKKKRSRVSQSYKQDVSAQNKIQNDKENQKTTKKKFITKIRTFKNENIQLSLAQIPKVCLQQSIEKELFNKRKENLLQRQVFG